MKPTWIFSILLAVVVNACLWLKYANDVDSPSVSVASTNALNPAESACASQLDAPVAGSPISGGAVADYSEDLAKVGAGRASIPLSVLNASTLSAQSLPAPLTLTALEELTALLQGDELNFITSNAIYELKERLVGELENNGALQAEVIDLFLADPAGDMGQSLKAVLQRVSSPHVEDMAIALAQSLDRNELLMGLEILQQQNGVDSGSTYVGRNAILMHAEDAEVVIAALTGFTEAPMSLQDQGETLEVMSQMLVHEDEGVRAESLRAFGRMAKTMEGLEPVLANLDGPNAIDAAFALYESPVSSVVLRDVLVARMADASLDVELRQVLAATLKRFSLAPEQHDAYVAFNKKHPVLE